MKKILIWDRKLKLTNSGGPMGYMWNIKNYLQDNPNEYVMFYSDIIDSNNIRTPISAYFNPIRIILSLLKRLGIPTLTRILNTYYGTIPLTDYEKNIIKTFDYVHFHNITYVKKFSDQLKQMGLKTILTTHTPEVMIDEIFCMSKRGSEFINKHSHLRRYFIEKERKCLEKADYLMYPCPQITECYSSNQASRIKSFIEANIDKTFYVPTALIDDNQESNNPTSYISKLNIPKESIKICYIGRHNQIKGYPYLKQIAAEILKKRRDIYFIIGGAESDEKPLNDSNWIELGWVDTKSLLKEIDIFILPNQNTYFDLIALEILRAGIPLITTYTGGNKYLATLNTKGILFIPKDNGKEAANLILTALSENYQEMGESNRKLYEKEFTMRTYIERYTTAINQL